MGEGEGGRRVGGAVLWVLWLGGGVGCGQRGVGPSVGWSER